MLHIAELSLPLDFTPEDLRRKTAARLKVPENTWAGWPSTGGR